MTRWTALGLLLWAGMAGAQEIGVADLDNAVQGADVVLLGEIHDNPAHHDNQARALAAMQPAAIVFEMLTPDQAGRVTPSLRKNSVLLGAVLEWDVTGWPDFAMYAPLFSTVPEAAIYGAALPRDQVRAAFSDGAATVFAGDAARFGLDQPLAEAEQAAREQAQFESHCEAMPLAMMGGMVEAQRLRDAAFSATVLQALAETGGPVAVIAGSGHTRVDWGMPVYLRQADPGLDILALGQLETGRGWAVDGAGDPPFDVWIVTDPVDRGDPCAAFGG